MKKSVFKLTRKDPLMLELVEKSDQKILAIWAIDCAERVLPMFEEEYPSDDRPGFALKTLKTWLKTGFFRMSVIRKASLDSHAAAREVGEDSAARSVARACGQAVATAHVKTHAYGAAIYAQQAIFRAKKTEKAEQEVLKERDWQYRHLLQLNKKGR